MPIPTDTALRTRARTLMEAMHESGRWVYAIPTDAARQHARQVLEAAGFECSVGEGVKLNVRAERASAQVLLREEETLEVTLVEASGSDSPEALGALLDKTGFFAQSTLLATAYDLGSEEASAALGTLAAMAVRWDARWSELFAAHMGSADEEQRLAAALALRRAGAASQCPPALRAFVDGALSGERSERVREALVEALALWSDLPAAGAAPSSAPTP